MLNPLRPWHRFVQQSLRLVVKGVCPLCQRATSGAFCPACQRRLLQCQRSPAWKSVSGLPIFAWGRYEGALKQAIAALKYYNQPQLAEPLGHWMAQAWATQAAGIRSAIVVPIPMHRQKQQQRGFNQAAKLAESFCLSTGLTLTSKGLTRVRATEAQFNLSIAARQQNLKDAFCLGTALAKQSPNHPVFLLDDIYTTGATVQAAAQTLRAHNIQVKGIIVLAMAERTAPSAPLP